MADLVTGLDIGYFSIKAVVLAHKGANQPPELVSLGAISAPSPGIISDSDVDLEVEAKAIKSLLTQIKAPMNKVITALPESKIFTRVIGDLPFLKDDELASAIRYSAEEFVPLPIDQVNITWVVINRSKERNLTEVLVIASPKNLINKYLKVFEMGQIRPIAIETEVLATTRALVGDNPFAPTTMVVQLGATTTDYAVVSKGVVLLTRSIVTGGMSLTRSISQYLNFEFVQAEEYKKVYGLAEDQLGGKIFQVLRPIVDVIATEAKRVIQAFQAKNPQNPIKRVVLSGGGAKLPGLVIYFANSLNLEVQEADPWFAVKKTPELAVKLTPDAPTYAVAVGLALRKE
jgi:type IV pilus assembly protein PilM